MPCNECPDSLEVNPNDGCLDPITSDCITYTGPAIPCLDITTGSSLDTVIDLLSDAICTLYDEQFVWDCALLNTCSINSLSDVLTSAPSVGQALTWNGTNWVNTTLVIPDAFECADLGECSINSLSNVDASPEVGDYLSWNGTNWVETTLVIPEAIPFTCDSLSGCSIDSLSDVITDAPSAGDVLLWNGSEWVNSTSLSDLITTVEDLTTLVNYQATQINYLLEHLHDCCSVSGAAIDADFSTTTIEVFFQNSEPGPGKVFGSLHLVGTGTQFTSLEGVQSSTVETSTVPATKYDGYYPELSGTNPSFDIQLLADQGDAIETGLGTNTLMFTVKFYDGVTLYWVDITADISGLVPLAGAVFLPVTTSIYGI